MVSILASTVADLDRLATSITQSLAFMNTTVAGLDERFSSRDAQFEAEAATFADTVGESFTALLQLAGLAYDAVVAGSARVPDAKVGHTRKTTV